jgi:hypothetical protein
MDNWSVLVNRMSRLVVIDALGSHPLPSGGLRNINPHRLASGGYRSRTWTSAVLRSHPLPSGGRRTINLHRLASGGQRNINLHRLASGGYRSQFVATRCQAVDSAISTPTVWRAVATDLNS